MHPSAASIEAHQAPGAEPARPVFRPIDVDVEPSMGPAVAALLGPLRKEELGVGESQVEQSVMAVEHGRRAGRQEGALPLDRGAKGGDGDPLPASPAPRGGPRPRFGRSGLDARRLRGRRESRARRWLSTEEGERGAGTPNLEVGLQAIRFGYEEMTEALGPFRNRGCKRSELAGARDEDPPAPRRHLPTHGAAIAQTHPR